MLAKCCTCALFGLENKTYAHTYANHVQKQLLKRILDSDDRYIAPNNC